MGATLEKMANFDENSKINKGKKVKEAKREKRDQKETEEPLTNEEWKRPIRDER